MAERYDLIDRTTDFGKQIILFARTIPKNTITLPLISQFIRAGTSVGANYSEADDAESKNDFKHKISICKKEAREVIYWLKMIAVACPELKDNTIKVYQEAKELNLIFNAIVKSCSKSLLEIRN